MRRFTSLFLVVLVSAGLLVLGPNNPARGATFVVNSVGDQSDAAPGSGGCDIGGGTCTLRAAIEEANANGTDNDNVDFSLPGPSFTISPTSPLPAITDSAMSIQGYTQPGYTGTNPVVEIRGSSAGAGAHGLTLAGSGGLVTAVAINGFSGDGIRITGDSNLVSESHIGTNTAGTVAVANGGNGIAIIDSPDNAIENNVISGNTAEGVFIAQDGSTGNQLLSNIIGLATNGNDLGNSASGVYINGASDNEIGNADQGNTISGNEGWAGVAVCGHTTCGGGSFGTPANNNRIVRNMIGVLPAGNGDRGNAQRGVSLDNADDTKVWNNVISGNITGIDVVNGSSEPDISGNKVGTDVSGVIDIGNTSHGLHIYGSSSPQIVDNLIAGNDQYGMFLTGGTTFATVRSNEVGLPGAPNSAGGIANQAATNSQIGGPSEGDGNHIHHNAGSGIVGFHSQDSSIQRNSIHDNGTHPNLVGIDIGGDGHTANVMPETETSALNYPTITGATPVSGGYEITGEINSFPSEPFNISVYSNDVCDHSGFGEGKTFLVPGNGISTNASGVGEWALETTEDIAGKILTATSQRQAGGDTSEFSECFAVSGEPPVELEAELELTTSTPEVGSSPTQVPFDAIPMQPLAPGLDTSGLNLRALGVGPLSNADTGVSGLNLRALGVGGLNLRVLGIGGLNLRALGIGGLNLRVLGIGGLNLRFLGIGGLVEDALCGLTLDQVSIEGGWDRFLEGSTLAGRPLQTVRFCDLKDIADAKLNELGEVTLNQLGYGNVLGDLNLYSTLLGMTAMEDIDISSLTLNDTHPAPTWEERLQKVGVDCHGELKRSDEGSCLSTSILEMQLAGVPFDMEADDGFPRLNALKMRDIDLDAGPAPLRSVALHRIPMAQTNFGSILLSDLPNRQAVVSDVLCTGCETLADAQEDEAILETATIDDLASTIDEFTLGEVAFALVPQGQNPFGEIPLDELGINAFDGEGSNTAEYTLSFTPNQDVEGIEFDVTLPDTFTYATGTAVTSEFCDGPCDAEPNVDGNVLTFEESGVNEGETHTITFRAFTGLKLGTFSSSATAAIGDFGVETGPSAAVRVKDAFEPNDTVNNATEIEPGWLYISHPSRDIYEFDAPDILGSQVNVYLEHAQTDLDLVLCHPETAPPPSGEPFREPGEHQRAIALPDEGRGLVGDARLMPQAADIPIPCQGLTAGISAHRGTDPEFVQTTSTTTSGKFYAQVTHYVGDDQTAASAEPYSLRVVFTPPNDPPTFDERTFPHDADPYGPGGAAETSVGTIAPIPPETRTIILFNRDRIHDDYGPQAASDLQQKLNEFAAHPTVGGAVLSVDADPEVRAALQARDATPNPELNNEVVREVLRAVDERLPANASSITNILVVGGDEQFPMARLYDPTIKGNESGYASELTFTGNNNALLDSFRAGYYLSDAPYGTFSPRPFLDRHLYVPEIAIGRLVETPAEMIAQLNQYLSPNVNGTINATKATVAAYDFNSDLGVDLTASKRSRYGAANVSSLVDDPNGDNDEWDAAELAAAVVGAQDLSLNGHYNHFALQPSTGRAATTSDNDVRGDGDGDVDLSVPGTILYTIGCHSGTPVFDGYSSTGDGMREREWAQERATGGVFVAQTGYGYGSRGAIGMHEWIIREFGRNVHSGTMTAGQALLFAQNAFLADGIYDVFDEKTLHTTALYGLSTFRIGTPTAPPPAPANTQTQPDPVSGLPSAPVHFEPSYTDVETADGEYQTVEGDSTAAAGGPRVARTPPRDVTPQRDEMTPNLRAHDALPVEMTTLTPDVGRNPLLDYPVLDDTNREPEPQVADVVFPDVLPQLTVNRMMTPNGPRDHVTSIVQQFRSTGFDGDGELIGDVESIGSMDALVFYSSAEDFIRPATDLIEGFVTGDLASFKVAARDDSGIERVTVLSRDVTGDWVRTDLQNSGAFWTGGRSIQGDAVEFCVGIVDGAGNVTFSCDKGRRFDSVGQRETPGVEYAVTGEEAPNAPWFHNAFVTFTAPSGVQVETSVDGGPYFPYSLPLAITGDGVHTVTYRTSAQESGTVLVHIDEGPSTVTSPNEGATYILNQPVTASYACNGGASGTVTCSGPSTVNTGVVGTHSYTVDTRDGAGHEIARPVTYRVVYAFEGFLAPVANPPATNRPIAGQHIPMRWRLKDANGARITSASTSIQMLSSARTACPGQPPISDFEGPYPNTTKFNGDYFEFMWKSRSNWKNTCRDFVLTLNDGTTHRARFMFKGGIVIQLIFDPILELTLKVSPGSF